MLTIQSKKLGDVWFALAENERGGILSSSFSLKGKQEAVQAILKSLPEWLRHDIKQKRTGQSSALHMMHKLYLGKSLRKRPSLDMRLISPFTRSVYRATRKIPKGFVTTYGIIAANVGNRFAQRAVGNAMRHNPFTLFVPCHRVVPSTLDVGHYSLSSHADSNSAVKRTLLVREGVEFNGDKVSRKSIWSFKPGGRT